MTLTFHAPRIVLSFVLLMGGATAAFAQETGSEPAPSSGGLFGGQGAARHGRHMLDFSLSVVAAHDSDTPDALRQVAPRDALVGGYSTMFMGSAEYHWEGSRFQFSASDSSVLRRYAELQNAGSVSHSAAVGLSTRLGARTTLSANQTAAYSPSYLFDLFPTNGVTSPGDAAPATPDYAVDASESYTYGTAVSLSRGLSRRSRISATGELRSTNFLHETGSRQDLSSQAVRGEFANDVARNTTIRAGYGYRTGTFGYGANAAATGADLSSDEHGVDVGVTYFHPLSSTRRMAFAFNIGTSAVNAPLSVLAPGGAVIDATTANQANRLYRVSSDASVAWQFSRSWQTRGTFRRGLEYIAQLTEPVFIDGVSGELGGLITSRMDVLAAARYSSGASALYRDRLTFNTYGVDFRARYALTRSLAVYAQYLYYYYDFQQDTQLPTGIPAGLERNGLRAGFTLWVPALRR